MTPVDSGSSRPFSVRAEQDGHVGRLTLEGEFDLLGLDPARTALGELLAGDATAIAIDLSGLSFIDSSGLRFMMEAHRSCVERGRDLRLIPGGPDVQRVFSLTGLDAVLPFGAAS